MTGLIFPHNRLICGGITSISYAYTTFAGSVGASPQTFSGRDIGTAAADRIVLVFVGRSTNDVSVSSATIGGVSATLSSGKGDSSALDVSAFWAVVPTGTTADVVTTFSTAPDTRIRIVIYAIYGAASTVHDEAGGTTTASIDIPAGGIGLFAGSGEVTSPSLSNLTTTDVTATVGGVKMAAGTKETATDLTGHTSTGTNVDAMYAVSFGPA